MYHRKRGTHVPQKKRNMCTTNNRGTRAPNSTLYIILNVFAFVWKIIISKNQSIKIDSKQVFLVNSQYKQPLKMNILYMTIYLDYILLVSRLANNGHVIYEPRQEISNNEACAHQRILRPACAYAQSDQSIC